MQKSCYLTLFMIFLLFQKNMEWRHHTIRMHLRKLYCMFICNFAFWQPKKRNFDVLVFDLKVTIRTHLFPINAFLFCKCALYLDENINKINGNFILILFLLFVFLFFITIICEFYIMHQVVNYEVTLTSLSLYLL